MATARELLEQADALMRRNRVAEPGPEIPELTEVVDADEPVATGDDSIADFGRAGDAPNEAAPLAQEPIIRGAASGPDIFPVLTEVVADLEPPAVSITPERADETIPWPQGGAEPVITFVAPAASGIIPLPPIPPAAPFAMDAREREAARWERLAEDIRMQVLQRIDIFTDTGMQEQLKERLQPIVDRASADLVATINAQVGQLLRTYVAEAIEREIDKWRQGGG